MGDGARLIRQLLPDPGPTTLVVGDFRIRFAEGLAEAWASDGDGFVYYRADSLAALLAATTPTAALDDEGRVLITGWAER